jgi:hypothetical protein
MEENNAHTPASFVSLLSSLSTPDNQVRAEAEQQYEALKTSGGFLPFSLLTVRASLTHSLTHSLTASVTPHSSTDPFTHSCKCTRLSSHWLLTRATHSLTHSFHITSPPTHSLTHSLTHCPHYLSARNVMPACPLYHTRPPSRPRCPTTSANWPPCCCVASSSRTRTARTRSCPRVGE